MSYTDSGTFRDDLSHDGLKEAFKQDMLEFVPFTQTSKGFTGEITKY